MGGAAYGIVHPGKAGMDVDYRDPNADGICCSLIHDQPRHVARVEDEDRPGARRELVVDLRDKPGDFFHRGGVCPCEGEILPSGKKAAPRLVTHDERRKQSRRVYTGAPKLWLGAPAPKKHGK